MVSPAIFLDRDGVLNRNRVNHVKCWKDFQFLPGALQALQLLAQLDLPIVVITNQAIINRGLATIEAVNDVHARMIEQVRRARGRIDHVYYCPHRPEESCDCRKPEPGMLLKAAADLGLDPARSVFVGDAVTDIVAGKRAGCATVLVRTGRGRRACRHIDDDPSALPDAIADDLFHAVPTLIEVLGRRSHSPQQVAWVPGYMELTSAGHVSR